MERRCTVDGCQSRHKHTAWDIVLCTRRCTTCSETQRPRLLSSVNRKDVKSMLVGKAFAQRTVVFMIFNRPHRLQQKCALSRGVGKWPRTKGLCTYHARDAGLETRRCKQEGCIKGPCRKGYCMVHARGRRLLQWRAVHENGVHGHEVVDDPAGDGMPMMMQQVPPSPASSEPIERRTLGRVTT